MMIEFNNREDALFRDGHGVSGENCAIFAERGDANVEVEQEAEHIARFQPIFKPDVEEEDPVRRLAAVKTEGLLGRCFEHHSQHQLWVFQPLEHDGELEQAAGTAGSAQLEVPAHLAPVGLPVPVPVLVPRCHPDRAPIRSGPEGGPRVVPLEQRLLSEPSGRWLVLVQRLQLGIRRAAHLSSRVAHVADRRPRILILKGAYLTTPPSILGHLQKQQQMQEGAEEREERKRDHPFFAEEKVEMIGCDAGQSTSVLIRSIFTTKVPFYSTLQTTGEQGRGADEGDAGAQTCGLADGEDGAVGLECGADGTQCLFWSHLPQQCRLCEDLM